jgi:hypothetical protein
MRLLLCIVLVTLAPLFARGQEIVNFRSGSLELKGVLYKPNGSEPFPAVLYNWITVMPVGREKARRRGGARRRRREEAAAWVPAACFRLPRLRA